MGHSKITINGFITYFKYQNSDLFLNLSVPAGIDKDVLTSNIILRGGEFEVMYSDPNFMQEAIGTWSKKWEHTFTRWVNALAIDYEPLENYNRKEVWTDSNISTRTNTGGTTSNSTTSNNGSSLDKVSAFNSDNMRNSESNTSSSTSSNSDSVTNNLKENINDTQTHNGQISGNIGVLTSQSMLREEISISAWNLIEHVTDIFLQEFVIPVY